MGLCVCVDGGRERTDLLWHEEGASLSSYPHANRPRLRTHTRPCALVPHALTPSPQEDEEASRHSVCRVFREMRIRGQMKRVQEPQRRRRNKRGTLRRVT